MAASRAALRLSSGLRTRAALNSLPRRGLATPVNLSGATQTTTLPNGFTVRLDAVERRS